MLARSARTTGLEPATSGVTGRCSNQLSYNPFSCEETQIPWKRLGLFRRKRTKKSNPRCADWQAGFETCWRPLPAKSSELARFLHFHLLPVPSYLDFASEKS